MTPFRRASVLLALALLVAAMVPRVYAQDSDLEEQPPPSRDALRWSLDSQYRFWLEAHNGLPLGRGDALDDTTLGQQVLELGGSVGYHAFDLHLGLRLFSGVLFGGPPCRRSTPGCDEGPGGSAYPRPYRVTDSLEPADVIVPRAAWLGIETPIGILRLGHMTSSWGLGLLANDGTDGPESSRSPLDFFNDRTHGDLVERIFFITRPLLAVDSVTEDSLAGWFYLGLGGDLVYLDENASLPDGDLAGQAVLAIGMRPPRSSLWGEIPDRLEWEAGAYSVYRKQRDRERKGERDTGLEIGAVDLFGRLRGPLQLGSAARPVVASAAVEMAWLFGSTTRVESEEGGAGQALGVEAYGIAGELVLELPAPRIDLGLRVGLATGDANPDDDTLYRFAFDRDFKAGLILFDHVLAELSASARDAAIDPGRSALPPHGIDELPTGGAIAGVLFVNPVVVARLLDGDLALAVGALWARASAPLVDPVASFERGGEPSNAFGGSTRDARSLGLELDLGVRYRLAFGPWGILEARAEYGVFLFGEALANARGERPEPVHYGSGRIGMFW